jgi:4-hydroxybenzoate polyprenyltransferase
VDAPGINSAGWATCSDSISDLPMWLSWALTALTALGMDLFKPGNSAADHQPTGISRTLVYCGNSVRSGVNG